MKKLVCTVTKLLTIVGAINWGLVGLLQIDPVQRLFGTMPAAVTAVYVIIGVSGLIYAGMELADNRLF